MSLDTSDLYKYLSSKPFPTGWALNELVESDFAFESEFIKTKPTTTGGETNKLWNDSWNGDPYQNSGSYKICANCPPCVACKQAVDDELKRKIQIYETAIKKKMVEMIGLIIQCLVAVNQDDEFWSFAGSKIIKWPMHVLAGMKKSLDDLAKQPWYTQDRAFNMRKTGAIAPWVIINLFLKLRIGGGPWPGTWEEFFKNFKDWDNTQPFIPGPLWARLPEEVNKWIKDESPLEGVNFDELFTLLMAGIEKYNEGLDNLSDDNLESLQKLASDVIWDMTVGGGIHPPTPILMLFGGGAEVAVFLAVLENIVEISSYVYLNNRMKDAFKVCIQETVKPFVNDIQQIQKQMKEAIANAARKKRKCETDHFLDCLIIEGPGGIALPNGRLDCKKISNDAKEDCIAAALDVRDRKLNGEDGLFERKTKDLNAILVEHTKQYIKCLQITDDNEAQRQIKIRKCQDENDDIKLKALAALNEKYGKEEDEIDQEWRCAVGDRGCKCKIPGCSCGANPESDPCCACCKYANDLEALCKQHNRSLGVGEDAVSEL